jgi:hypothetical protein
VALLIDVATARAISLWDERYFMGKTTVTSARLRMAGYRLVEELRAIVEHGSRRDRLGCVSVPDSQLRYFMLKNYRMSTLLALLPARLWSPFLLLAARDTSALVGGAGHREVDAEIGPGVGRSSKRGRLVIGGCSSAHRCSFATIWSVARSADS